MKQITVTLHEAIDPDDDRDYLAVFRATAMNTDSEDYREVYSVGARPRSYILMDDLTAAVEAALKEGE